MSSKLKITELPAGGAMIPGDIIPVVRDGKTYQVDAETYLKSLTSGTSAAVVETDDPANPVIDVLRSTSLVFSLAGNVAGKRAMKLGEVSISDNDGGIAPFKSLVRAVTYSRGEAGEGILSLLVNGVVVDSMTMDATGGVIETDQGLAAGDKVALEVEPGTAPGSKVSNIVATVIMEEIL